MDERMDACKDVERDLVERFELTESMMQEDVRHTG